MSGDRGTRKRSIPYVFVWTGDKLSSKVDLSGMCRAFQVNGKVDGPGATFTLDLIPSLVNDRGPQTTADRSVWLFQTLQANRLVSIGFDEPGGITLGLITKVTRTRKKAGPTVDLGLRIEGMNLGKVLTQDQIIKAQVTVPDAPTFRRKISLALGDDTPLLVMLEGQWGPKKGGAGKDKDINIFLGKSVSDIIDWILSSSVSMKLPFMAEATGGSGRAGDFIDTSTTVTVWNDGRILSQAPHQYHGTVWGFIQSLLDRDFYEVRVDNIPNGSDLPSTVLIVRPKPFDEKALDYATTSEHPGTDWESLTTLVHGREHHVIHSAEVMSSTLSHGDEGALSYYLVQSDHELLGNSQGQAEGLFYPIVDTWNAKRFGVRAYNARLQIVSSDIREKARGETDYAGEVRGEVREMRNRLFNWYRLNPFFLNGSIVVEGKDEYRAGDPVFLPEEYPTQSQQPGVRFYAQGVTHAWHFGGHYSCTFNVVRGHNDAMVDAVDTLIAADADLANISHFAET